MPNIKRPRNSEVTPEQMQRLVNAPYGTAHKVIVDMGFWDYENDPAYKRFELEFSIGGTIMGYDHDEKERHEDITGYGSYETWAKTQSDAHSELLKTTNTRVLGIEWELYDLKVDHPKVEWDEYDIDINWHTIAIDR